MKVKFLTAFNCIDGRVQETLLNWLKKEFNANYVDMITEPGPDKMLLHGSKSCRHSVREKLALSVEKHNSEVIAIAGHYDCAANPCSRQEHEKQISKCVHVIKKWFPNVYVLGVWINENWEVEYCTIEQPPQSVASR